MKFRAISSIFYLSAVLALTACSHIVQAQASGKNPYMMDKAVVKPGIEVLLDDPQYLKLVKGKRVGLITNPSGVDSNLVSTIDLMHQHPDINLVALFGPEHGIRGEAYAGDHVENYVDEPTSVTVYSLYGKTRRPKKEWLENLDVLVYDIQDVGSSSYTYIYTMSHSMEEAAKMGIPFIVLDRPNPVGADYVDGPVLDTTQFKSFIGYYDIAYMYGLTPGETAMLFDGEFIEDDVDLHVVPMKGYKRWMRQWDTGLPFVPTSTHIPHAQHAFYYSTTGILGEIRNALNIGVGYTLPFETLAAPWIDRDEFTEALRAKNIPGVKFRPITYTPRYAGYEGEQIQGVHIMITDYYEFRPVTAQIHMMEVIQRLYPEFDLFSDDKAGKSAFDKVLADAAIRKMILEGKTADEIISYYQPRVEEFKKTRANYLIYK